jgi:hypothetical protein
VKRIGLHSRETARAIRYLLDYSFMTGEVLHWMAAVVTCEAHVPSSPAGDLHDESDLGIGLTYASSTVLPALSAELQLRTLSPPSTHKTRHQHRVRQSGLSDHRPLQPSGSLHHPTTNRHF